jgi:hypothetical protein
MVVNAHCRAVSTPGVGVSAAIVTPRVHRAGTGSAVWTRVSIKEVV